MTREQGQFGPGVGIVDPYPYIAGHSYPPAVRRIGDRAVTIADVSFAEAGDSAIGQPPAGMVLCTDPARQEDSRQHERKAQQRKALHPDILPVLRLIL